MHIATEFDIPVHTYKYCSYFYADALLSEIFSFYSSTVMIGINLQGLKIWEVNF